MVVYSFYIFDRHAACIYSRKFVPSALSARPPSSSANASAAASGTSTPLGASAGGIGGGNHRPQSLENGSRTTRGDTRDRGEIRTRGGDGGRGDGEPEAPGMKEQFSAEDDAKLVFGTVYSLRGLVRKLGGEDDNFVSYRTSHYKLHYYETPTSLKFVMVTDTRTNNLRIVLHQIYVSLYVEYVVKNPLSPVEHPGGLGVNCEMFELGLEQFINGSLQG